jgi:hypothetical protein
MADLITNKDTRCLNGYPPNGSDMGPVRRGTTITPTGTSTYGKVSHTGYRNAAGQFRCIPSLDLSPVGVTPPPVDPPPVIVDPPVATDRTLLVLEFVNGAWTNARYFQVKEVDGT